MRHPLLGEIPPIYLAPTTAIRGGQFDDCFGLFETIGSGHDVSGWTAFGIDNGCFTGAFTEEGWLDMLSYYPLEHRIRCLFALVPDEPMNAQGTLNLFKQYHKVVLDLGYPVGFATQNGMTPEMVPWDDIHALFIGGDDHHKRGKEGGALIAEAARRGKWIHVGRVNSGSAIRHHFWMAHSWDGTTLARHPRQQYQDIGREVLWVRTLGNKQPFLPM